MMRVCIVLTVAAVLSGVVIGQTTRPRPTFGIADVHESPRIITSNSVLGRIGGKAGFRTSLRGERFEVRNATMVDLIGTAYMVDSDRVIGGPSWLEFDQFDVTALVPPNTQATLNLMLQSLLADRFRLMVHSDTKLMPGFVLSVGKSKLKTADASGKGCQSQPVIERQMIMVNLSCRNITMEAFAAELKGLAGGYVVDSTGLKGSWDFDIRFTDNKGQPAGSERVTLFDAINTQLGLRLQEQTVPTPVITVDAVNEQPSVNLPDVARRLPPLPPAEFDVAVIKPTGTGGNEVGPGGIQPGGRVIIPGLFIPLHSLISVAWNLDPNEELIGAPKWLDSARFDMIATLPSAFRGANAATAPIPEMLQALLIDRFKMKVHYEDRPVTAYALVAAKPKLKEAEPSTRTGCKLGNGVGTGPAFQPSRTVSCQHITMAQFANQLQSIAGPYGGAYVRYPVADATRLDGSWDFSFTFNPLAQMQLAGRGNPFSGPAGAISDPVGGLSFVDAIDKQLGLKLEAQKRTYPVFIIDHIEESPTDN